MNDVKQFILSNGDEIVCEVVEWANDIEVDMVVRRAYKVVTVDDPIKGVRFFTLRPWLLMQSGNDLFNTINSQHILAEANPTEKVMEQYRSAIREAEMDQEELMNERIEKATQKFRELQERLVPADDSDSSNVVYLGKFEKDKLH